ncbi:polysaccharide pyruvyl transferase family protein [Mongoliitalea daihaiensis]|uniref:polysaccharide pyruvyl transferase family protein n=1 Tax=Mongoliitalea daihaiensis TaxID=2782006 RepID=UPI001F2957F5|nr:polysaccharide pyruvyl transferase family protein [Mongoliitalea daihaiensis]UJP64908.1 polysaccharide pyruvyl transferase family protein [Mongoliitalea daihaiensis]
MKVGILTFHYMINQGSVLQAYCVYQLLKEKFPSATIEIIDLVPKSRGENEKKYKRKRPPFFNFSSFEKYTSVRKFLSKRCKFSPFSGAENINDQINFINSLNYDIIFTGSDTVWMDSEKLHNVLPHIYFLPNQIKAKKCSIAASLDPLKSLDNYKSKAIEIKATLKDYEHILVRDFITEGVLRGIGVRNISQISDPTILYPFEKNLKLKTNKNQRVSKNKVHVSFGDKTMKKTIENLLEDRGYIIDQFSEKSSIFQGDHIVDYLNEYAGIDILITDRFHRSIFALKLSSSLVINVEHYLKNPTSKSKGRDLFEKIGLPEFCIRYDKGDESGLLHEIESLIEHWDDQTLQVRDQKVSEFISVNQNFWNNLTFSIQ